MSSCRFMIVVQWSGSRAPMPFGTWDKEARAEAEAARWRKKIEQVWVDRLTRPSVFVQAMNPASAFEPILTAEVRFLERNPAADEQALKGLLEEEHEEPARVTAPKLTGGAS